MAVDDIISDVFVESGAGSTDFQPAAGVEIVITGFSSNTGTSAQQYMQYDGTGAAQVLDGTAVAVLGTNSVKFGITNTNYIRLTVGGAAHVGYFGIQTK